MLKPLTMLAAACLSAGVSAQSTGERASGSGGLAGLLGGGLPNVGSVGAGNAAGLLGYCLKNNLLGAAGSAAGTTDASASTSGTGAQSVLDRLTGRKGVQSSPAYQAGQSGQVQTLDGRTLPLGSLGGQLKTRMCSLVLNRAKSFL